MSLARRQPTQDKPLFSCVKPLSPQGDSCERIMFAAALAVGRGMRGV
jgi:hypothetical protein